MRRRQQLLDVTQADALVAERVKASSAS